MSVIVLFQVISASCSPKMWTIPATYSHCHELQCLPRDHERGPFKLSQEKSYSPLSCFFVEVVRFNWWIYLRSITCMRDLIREVFNSFIEMVPKKKVPLLMLSSYCVPSSGANMIPLLPATRVVNTVTASSWPPTELGRTHALWIWDR